MSELNVEITKDARACLNYDDPDSLIVLDLLRGAGYGVRSVFVEGLSKPRVIVKSGTYSGLKQIRQMIEADSQRNQTKEAG